MLHPLDGLKHKTDLLVIFHNFTDYYLLDGPKQESIIQHYEQ